MTHGRVLTDACLGICAAVAVAALLRLFVAGAAFVPSESMARTLSPGDFVLVNKLGRSAVVVLPNTLLGFRLQAFRTPAVRRTRVGEIVLFHPPVSRLPGSAGGDALFLKRCIATGGDTVEFREDGVTVNRRPLALPTTAEAWGGRSGKAPASLRGITVVPEGHVFLLGDNPGRSLDSRILGCVSEDRIVGSAVMIYWSMWPPGAVRNGSGWCDAIRWNRIGTVLR